MYTATLIRRFADEYQSRNESLLLLAREFSFTTVRGTRVKKNDSTNIPRDARVKCNAFRLQPRIGCVEIPDVRVEAEETIEEKLDFLLLIDGERDGAVLHAVAAIRSVSTRRPYAQGYVA